MPASTMRHIDVALANNPYRISIGRGLANRIDQQLQSMNQGQMFVVISQANILALHSSVVANLKSSGLRVEIIQVAEDESAKNLAVAEHVWSKMLSLGCDRSTVILALGGGVVGDLAGFVAATYMRGISFVQIPTTLLAMIDSAIGGKTGVNLAAGKNLVGAIYQPTAVLIDTDFLQTLPRRVVVSSLAEAVKYGLIRDASIFTVFEERFDELRDLSDETLLLEIIEKSCRIKSEIVVNDEYENGERRLLNFGHTIGHALETTLGYGELYHGEAVIYGMRCANQLSAELGLLDASSQDRVEQVLARFSLPPLSLDVDSIVEAISHDKKNINGKLHFIVLNTIGEASVTDQISTQQLENVLTLISSEKAA